MCIRDRNRSTYGPRSQEKPSQPGYRAAHAMTTAAIQPKADRYGRRPRAARHHHSTPAPNPAASAHSTSQPSPRGQPPALHTTPSDMSTAVSFTHSTAYSTATALTAQAAASTTWSRNRSWSGGNGFSMIPPARSLAVPSHDIGSSVSGSAGVGREAIGERDDEVAQFSGALDDERPVE